MRPVEIFAAAFDSDPVFSRLFLADRAAALRAWFGTVVDVLDGCSRAEIRCTGDAAAAWTTGFCPPCLERLDDELTALVRSRAGAAGIDLTARVQAAGAPIDVPAWSLHWLGVAPDSQGRGHGGRLLDEVLGEAHGSDNALSTTTPNPAAVPFYGRRGLAPLAVREVTGEPGLRFWTLLAPVPV